MNFKKHAKQMKQNTPKPDLNKMKGVYTFGLIKNANTIHPSKPKGRNDTGAKARQGIQNSLT